MDKQELMNMDEKELITIAESKFKELDLVMQVLQERFPPPEDRVYGFTGNGHVFKFYCPSPSEDE